MKVANLYNPSSIIKFLTDFGLLFETTRLALNNLGKAPTSKLGKIAYVFALFALTEGLMGFSDTLGKDILNFFGIETTDPEKRAGGGPVSKGNQYIVGENGPELFIPKEDGRIVANSMIEAMKVDQSQLRAAIASMDENNLPPNIVSFPIAGGKNQLRNFYKRSNNPIYIALNLL